MTAKKWGLRRYSTDQSDDVYSVREMSPESSAASHAQQSAGETTHTADTHDYITSTTTNRISNDIYVC